MFIIIDNARHEIDSFIFNGGEISVKVPDIPQTNPFNRVVIYSYIRSSDDVMKTFMVIDAVRRQYEFDKLVLNMPYIPYARQDRVCNKGEAFSLKVFAQILNSFNLDEVVVSDSHSDVATALINNVRHNKQQEEMENLGAVNRVFDGVISCSTFVSPDAGANKKISEACKTFGKGGFIRADKLREMSTGKIIETVVYADKLSGDYLIVDDLCDAGGTFIALAQELKKKGADRVHLYVTHGIFSKGKQHLLDNGLDGVYSAYDWTTMEEQNV